MFWWRIFLRKRPLGPFGGPIWGHLDKPFWLHPNRFSKSVLRNTWTHSRLKMCFTRAPATLACSMQPGWKGLVRGWRLSTWEAMMKKSSCQWFWIMVRGKDGKGGRAVWGVSQFIRTWWTYKYIWQCGQIHLTIWTNTFNNLDKYIWQFGKIHFKERVKCGEEVGHFINTWRSDRSH